MNTLFTEESFDKIDYKESGLPKGEYDSCIFKYCDLSNVDLSGTKFIDCKFLDCNISLAKLHKTTFRSTAFKDCKLIGLKWESCNEFGLLFNFENCNLNHSSFYQMKIKHTTFKKTQLQDVDFTECDLSSSVFDYCDLTNAVFDNTVLEKANFITSYDYSIDPEKNKIKKAKFSMPEVVGLLDKYQIEIER